MGRGGEMTGKGTDREAEMAGVTGIAMETGIGGRGEIETGREKRTGIGMLGGREAGTEAGTKGGTGKRTGTEAGRGKEMAGGRGSQTGSGMEASAREVRQENPASSCPSEFWALDYGSCKCLRIKLDFLPRYASSGEIMQPEGFT